MPDDYLTYGAQEIYARIEQEEPVVSFWRDRYFPRTIVSDDEDVLVEVQRKGVVVLPSVHRGDSANFVGRLASHEVRKYTPAFSSNFVTLTVKELAKRVFGEPLRKPWSPEVRASWNIAQKTRGLEDSYTLGEEAQVSELLQTGKVTPRYIKEGITEEAGEVIDFGTDDALVGGAASTLWTVDNDVLSLIAQYFEVLFEKGQEIPTEMTLGADALAILLNNKYVQKVLDLRRYLGALVDIRTITPDKRVAFNAQLPIPGFGPLNVLSYRNQYARTDGTVTQMLGKKDMLLASPGFGGMGYGALYTKIAGKPVTIAGKRILHTKEGDVKNNFTLESYLQTAPLPIPLALDKWMYKQVVA